MLRRRPFLALPFLALAGCYAYVPVEVRVVHAETRQPMAGIRVDVDYRRFMEFFPPRFDSAVTDADGVARVDVCTNYGKGGDVALLGFPDGYLLSEPMPKGYVELSVRTLRDATSTHRVDVGLLPLTEYRRRYPP